MSGSAAKKKRPSSSSTLSIESLTRRSLAILDAFDPTEYLLGGGRAKSREENGAGIAAAPKRDPSTFQSWRPVVKRRRMLPPRPESASNTSTTATATTTSASSPSKKRKPQEGKSEDPNKDNYSGNYLYGVPIPPPPEQDRCATCHKTTEPPDCKEDVLLCDGPGCGREYHFQCCVPTLLEIPEGSWLCQDCSSQGSTATLHAYFDKMKDVRDQNPSRVQHLLGLILQDAEQVSIPQNEIPLSELERAHVYHTTALQAPSPAQPTSTVASPALDDHPGHDDHVAHHGRVGREFFLGKPLKLYDALHDHFHTGRIVDYRRTYEDGISDFEYLVRFPAGSDDRKASASYWIALEEHNVSIGTTLVQLRTRLPVPMDAPAAAAAAAAATSSNKDGRGTSPVSAASPVKKRRGRPPTAVAWVPAMVWLRSTRALLSLYGINPDFNMFLAAKAAASASPDDLALQTPAAKGKSPASPAASKAKPKSAAANNKRQLWAAVCPFGSGEILECDLVSQTSDFAAAAAAVDPDPLENGESTHEGGDKVRFLNWLAMSESQAQERVRQWHALPLRNQRHNYALTYRDEAALGPLVPVNYAEPPNREDPGVDSSSSGSQFHAQLCPLVSPGLDRTRLLQIARQHHPDGLDLTKDVASTLTCRIVSLSDMETT